MHLNRAIFKNEIVAEFCPPTRFFSKKPARVVVLCDGLPSLPGKHKLIKFLARQGFWVFYPRYRGSWESSGFFLDKSPDKDVLDLISELNSGFVDLFSGVEYKINRPQFFVLGASFGGAVALLASLSEFVKKVVAVAPVVDWREIDEESFWTEQKFIKKAFNMAYRTKAGSEEKLRTGKIFNPVDFSEKYSGKKIIILHAADDDLVPFGPARDLAAKIGAKFFALKKGGHLSLSIILKYRWRFKIMKFLK